MEKEDVMEKRLQLPGHHDSYCDACDGDDDDDDGDGDDDGGDDANQDEEAPGDRREKERGDGL